MNYNILRLKLGLRGARCTGISDFSDFLHVHRCTDAVYGNSVNSTLERTLQLPNCLSFAANGLPTFRIILSSSDEHYNCPRFEANVLRTAELSSQVCKSSANFIGPACYFPSISLFHHLKA